MTRQDLIASGIIRPAPTSFNKTAAKKQRLRDAKRLETAREADFAAWRKGMQTTDVSLSNKSTKKRA